MRPQELNLLMVFDAIMTEGSITRAADRLAMTQPAVSNAVSRMRVVWKDELFVKEGRNIRPTRRALELWNSVRDPLKDLGRALAPNSYDPATSTRTFRVAAPVGVVDVSWPQLRRLIEAEAPGVSVHALPYNSLNGEQLLTNAEVDIVISVSSMIADRPYLLNEYLYGTHYMAVMRAGHPLAEVELDLEAFSNADHLLVSLSGDTSGFTDRVLAQNGLKRKIAMTVNHFNVLAPILESSDLITVAPTMTVEEAVAAGTLILKPSPVELTKNSISAFWHQRQDRDPGLRWLRQKLGQVLRARADEHEEIMAEHCKFTPPGQESWTE
ncbi:MAG: LysR family transcriptional regulator [Pseudomonadota bacterium]